MSFSIHSRRLNVVRAGVALFSRLLLLVVAAMVLFPFSLRAEEAPKRVALVASCRELVAHELAALAEVYLAKHEGIELLERQETQLLMDEQYLSVHQMARENCGASQMDEALAVGSFLNVDVFASLEFSVSKNALGLVTFDAVTGVKLGDVTLRSNDIESQATEIVSSVLRSIEKKAKPLDSLKRVCVRSVRDSSIGGKHRYTCQTIAKLLERRLVDSDSIVLLERARLDAVNTEVLLSGQTTENLLPSFTLLDLSIVESDDRAELFAVVSFSDGVGNQQGEVRVKMGDTPVLELAENLIDKLLETLGAAAISNTVDRKLEAGRFREDAKFAFEVEEYEAAVEALEACVAFDPENSALQHDRYEYLGMHALDTLEKRGTDGFSDALTLVFRAVDAYEIALHLTAAPGRQFTSEKEMRNFSVGSGLASIWNEYRKNYMELALKLFPDVSRAEQRAFREFQQRAKQVFFYDLLGRLSEAGHYRYSTKLNQLAPILSQFVDSSEMWTTDTITIFRGYGAMFQNRTFFNGGWVMVNIRPLARLCWKVYSKQAGHLELNSDDLLRLRGLFQELAAHRDPIISAYGRIGIFALDIQGHEQLTEAHWALFDSIRAELYELASNPLKVVKESAGEGELKIRKKTRKFYGTDAYCALRDLIDFLPTPKLRLQKHEELFEWTLQRKRGVYTTLELMVNPDACRFMHYKRYGDIFDHEKIGYQKSDYPQLAANAERFQAVRAMKGFSSVDLGSRSFYGGSFDTEFQCMLERVLEDTRKPFWKSAEKVYHGKAAITGSLFHEGYLYFSTSHKGMLQCLKMSPTGEVVTLGELFFPEEKSEDCRCRATGFCLDGGFVYVGIKGIGIFQFSINDEQEQEPRFLEFDACLPAESIYRFTCLNGVIYAGVSGGYLFAYDLETRRCETLAASSRLGNASPFDEHSPALSIASILSDPTRNQIYFATSFGDTTCDPLLGLWKLDADSHEMAQVFRSHQPVKWLAWQSDGSLLAHIRYAEWYSTCTWYHFGLVVVEPDTEKITHLCSDTNWKKGRKRGGPDIPQVSYRIRLPHHLYYPILVLDKHVWMLWKNRRLGKDAKWRGYRLGLEDGKLESFVKPEQAGAKEFENWGAYHHIPASRTVLAVSWYSVWAIHLEDSEGVHY